MTHRLGLGALALVASFVLSGCGAGQVGTYEHPAPVRAPTTRVVSQVVPTGTITSCLVNGDQPSVKGQTTVGPDPAGVVAEWLPDLNARPCIAVLVHGESGVASALANDIRKTPRWPSGTFSCPADDGAAVRLYFQYPDHRPTEEYGVDLTGCNFNTSRFMNELESLNPHVWQTPELHNSHGR